jgi:hypothetical protein
MDKLYRGKNPKQLADSLEALEKRLYDRKQGKKPKSRLVDPKKTKIPGFSYWFRKK